MRQSRSSGSAEGVVGNHDPYSDTFAFLSRSVAGEGRGEGASVLSRLRGETTEGKQAVKTFSTFC